MTEHSETSETEQEHAVPKVQEIPKNVSPKEILTRVKRESHEFAVEMKERLIDPVIHLSNVHLEEVEQSYASHFVETFLLGCKMFFGGSLAMVHAVFPCIARDCSSICRDIREPKLKNE